MDASVEFLLGNLKQLVIHHVDLIEGAETDFKELNEELESLQAILKDASRKLKKDEAFKKWERKVRDVVYDVEDMIDICVTQAASKSKRSSISRFFRGSNIGIAEAVRKIRYEQVRPLFDKVKVDFANLAISDMPDTTAENAMAIRQKKSQNIVGFKKETDEFINFLNGESQGLGISTIVGMAGLGKTTLAWKIFEHQSIKYEFPVRIWVNISDVLNMKNVLLTILRKFAANAKEETEEEMISKVKAQLNDGKFLIVMDDIWALDAWNVIKQILPMHNSLGRVLVTTRQTNVAEHASSKDRAHYLRFLTPDESWQLLQFEVYGKLDNVPDELVGIGKVIATDCDGLPLSIVVIGGILVEKKSRALAVKKEWEEISKSVKPYLVGGDKKNLLASIIALSYEKLPYELRNCFLYLGVFPDDADIPVNKLIRLWIAEGFVQRNNKGSSLEQVGYENLKDLINRNLVMVRKATIDGEPRVCHIHDSVREICKSQASFENLNLFQEITREQGAFGSRDNIDKCRRICIHSYVLDFFKMKQKIPKARSFLCFHESSMILKPTDMSSVTDGFGLLRVYDAKNIKFPKFPQKLVQLLHLRYLTLVMDQCSTLPENISDLWNLQTLTVDISAHILEMKVDLWKMRQLRHFKTKASIILRKDGRGEGGDNLQTLSRLSSESCTDHVFTRAKNLITLGVQGDLNQIASIGCFEILDKLNKLKLVHEGKDGVAKEGHMRRIPDAQSFPPNLKTLVLCSTYLDWSKMDILSRLGSLEVLKLKENAFQGKQWEAQYAGFHHLEQLHIERASILVHWTARGDPFPKLKILVLNNCENLIEVPLAISESLELISLERVTESVVSSAKKIEEYLKKKSSGKDGKGGSFKLEIARGDRH